MSQGVRQSTFAGGEVSPAIESRADLAKRITGAKTMRNFFVAKTGAALNRGGTRFVVEVKNSADVADPASEYGSPETLIAFIFSRAQSYVLLFGANYIRVIKNGEPLWLKPATWLNTLDYLVGDTVTHSGADWYCRVAHTQAAPVTPGTDPDVWYELPTPPAWYSGLATSMLEIPTPYAAGVIMKQNVAQSADVMTIVHRLHPPHELLRWSNTRWELRRIAFEPSIGVPSNFRKTGGKNSRLRQYAVTAVAQDTFEETAAGYYSGGGDAENSPGKNDADIVANPDNTRIRISNGFTSHKQETGEMVHIVSCTPTVGDVETDVQRALTGRTFRVNKINNTTFELQQTEDVPFPETAHTVSWRQAYVSYRTPKYINDDDGVDLVWDEVPGAAHYNIYRTRDTGFFGYIGTSTTPSFFDNRGSEDYEVSPPLYLPRLERAGRYPHTTGFMQQRQCYGQTTDLPTTVWLSRSGSFRNLNDRFPLLGDDAMEIDVSGPIVNEVRHLIALDQLLMFTLGTYNTLSGGQDGVIMPDAFRLRTGGQVGASNVHPIVAQNTCLFVQSSGCVVRALTYDSATDGYSGDDLTLFSQHLFTNFCIHDIDWQEFPHNLLWAVRSDGKFLSLTYDRIHEMAGWAQHVTSEKAGDAKVLSVAVVPERNWDVVYLLVERNINSATVRYVEKMWRRGTNWAYVT